MIIETLFDIGDMVMIDGDKSIKCVIIGITVCDIRQNINYKVGWMDSGLKSGDVDEWRLAKWDDGLGDFHDWAVSLADVRDVMSGHYSFLERVGLLCLAAAVASCIIQWSQSQFAAGMIMGFAIWEASRR